MQNCNVMVIYRHKTTRKGNMWLGHSTLLSLYCLFQTNQYHQTQTFYHKNGSRRCRCHVLLFQLLHICFFRAEGKGDGNSWADKVRGKTSHTSPQMEGFSTPTPGSPQIQSSNSPVSPGPVLPSPPPKQNGHMDDVDTDGSTTIEGLSVMFCFKCCIFMNEW